jgi:hypothetical protein
LGGVDWIRLAQDRDRWWASGSCATELDINSKCCEVQSGILWCGANAPTCSLAGKQ